MRKDPPTGMRFFGDYKLKLKLREEIFRRDMQPALKCRVDGFARVRRNAVSPLDDAETCRAFALARNHIRAIGVL